MTVTAPMNSQPNVAPTSGRHELISPDGIDLVYRNVLGRPADAEGKAHFTSLIEPYKLTSGRLMYILADSAEFKMRSPEARQAALKLIDETAHPAEAVHWFHSITLPDGYVTNGMQTQDSVDLVFKHSLAGKSVLDIGAWDGFYSFEAERQGAADVLSTDWYCWNGPGWGSRAGFDTARKLLNSKVRATEVDVFDLDPTIHGRFDVVLFLGVLYHLVDPLGGLRKAAEMTTDHLIILTHTRNNEIDRPLMEYVEGLNGDATTYWYTNIACITSILRHNGFTRFEVLDAPPGPENGEPRQVVHAWR